MKLRNCDIDKMFPVRNNDNDDDEEDEQI
jgi:hypothetical protein